TIPVIERIRAKSDVPLSIDTYRLEVARAALDAGADAINDVTAFSHDEDMASLAASRDVSVVLMHMQGTPRTMQQNPHYDDVVAEIYRFLSRAVSRAEAAGVRRDRIAVDPGFGFGKTVQHNLEMLRRLHEFRSLGCPVLIGTSRKSTIGKVLDRPVDERLFGTAATVALAVRSGAAILRVHDVAQTRDVVRMTEAILGRTQQDQK
ncbi:MAG: dihydropteroate synthase, partial [Planctomycetes bacterium SM23_65]